MIRNLLLNLEDKNHPLLGPTLWGLKSWGLWQPNRGLSSKIYNLIHVGAILFVISQYIELWRIRSNFAMALRNLSVSMLSTVCVVKAGTYVCWQKYWKEVVEYVSNLEKNQLAKKDHITDVIIAKYTKYSRRVSYFYWFLVAATVFTLILAPCAAISSSDFRVKVRNSTAAYPEIMSSWAPFDRTRGLGYWVIAIEQALICFYGGGIVATYDSNAMVLMSFFAGQMELLNINSARLFEGEQISNSEAMQRIKDCHQHHSLLVKHSEILNNLLSPVMFLYVIICSLMICASAIQITMDGTTSMQRIWIAEYLLALIAQLFLYCWHSNEVLVMSNKVDDGVYVSDWWTRDVRICRSILLLGGQLRKTVVFTAGPFTNLSLPTFLAILKGSYSYYTLLSKKED